VQRTQGRQKPREVCSSVLPGPEALERKAAAAKGSSQGSGMCPCLAEVSTLLASIKNEM